MRAIIHLHDSSSIVEIRVNTVEEIAKAAKGKLKAAEKKNHLMVVTVHLLGSLLKMSKGM